MDSLANTRVVKRRLFVVECDVMGPQAGRLGYADVGTLLTLIPGSPGNVEGVVGLASQDGSASFRPGNGVDNVNPIEIGQAGYEVVGVGAKLPTLVRGMVLEHKRACAGGDLDPPEVAVVRVQLFIRVHDHIASHENLEEVWRGVVQGELDGVVVNVVNRVHRNQSVLE